MSDCFKFIRAKLCSCIHHRSQFNLLVVIYMKMSLGCDIDYVKGYVEYFADKHLPVVPFGTIFATSVIAEKMT